LVKGVKDHERSIVVIDNGRYYGFGYFDAFDQINNAEEFKGFVSNKLYYPDTNLIIKGWMNRRGTKD
jgi:DNA polymerase-3 subunit epsilon